jgi:hypothetical protein
VSEPVQFSGDELLRLRRMLETHEKAAWLWTSVGIWAKWIIAVAAAVAIIRTALSGIIPWGGIK